MSDEALHLVVGPETQALLNFYRALAGEFLLVKAPHLHQPVLEGVGILQKNALQKFTYIEMQVFLGLLKKALRVHVDFQRLVEHQNGFFG